MIKEMKPEWFDEVCVPYESMWRDDIFWLPHGINNKFVKAYFAFAANHEDIVHKEMSVFDTSIELHNAINKK